MSAAKETFSKLDVNKLLDLRNLGFKLSSNFHISYRSSNLLWFKGLLSFEDYIEFWKKEYVNLKQIKRENFTEYFKYLEDNNLIEKKIGDIQESIINKKV